MQPYEIRQLSDGSIDYSQYYARPLSLATPAMRRLLRQAVSRRATLVVISLIATAAIASPLIG
jgi:hypothetical protein